ncbi:MAG: apolipoprotein N-acyltransferase [Limisphaerales bacterium]
MRRLRLTGSILRARARPVLAIIAGLALALAFPLPGWSGLAWIAPGLLLGAVAGAAPGRAFRLGYLAGLVHFLTSLRWLLNIPFPIGATAGWLALSAYLALFPAAWACLGSQLMRRFLAQPANPDAGDGIVESLRQFARCSWRQRTVWALVSAAAWVAWEMVQGRFLSGFPWNFLGASQYQVTPLIQIASITGVYGVSFVVVWTSAALLSSAARLATRPGPGQSQEPLAGTRFPRSVLRGPFRRAGPVSFTGAFRWAPLADLGLPLAVVVFLTFSGAARSLQPMPAGRELRVALVQPSIPQELIFNPGETTNRFDALLELSQLAAATRPDLILWPEASMPTLTLSRHQALTNFIATHQAWMILGSDDYEEITAPCGGAAYDAYNAAFLFQPDGRHVGTYRKRRLVIFGEYIPFGEWLTFMNHLSPIEGSFRTGPGPVPFRLGGLAVNTSVLICFEDVFPHGVREYVAPDTDFLINLTNNGWFGESSAHWQHAASAVFRAVENGLPLVRCTNNGLTCWIDARGRMRDRGTGDPTNIYRAGFTTYRIPLLPEGSVRPPTFYREYGDLFGWSCTALTGLTLLLLMRRRHPTLPSTIVTP